MGRKEGRKDGGTVDGREEGKEEDPIKGRRDFLLNGASYVKIALRQNKSLISSFNSGGEKISRRGHREGKEKKGLRSTEEKKEREDKEDKTEAFYGEVVRGVIAFCLRT